MNSEPAGPLPDPSSWALLELAGDEAILPAGIRLADEDRPGRQCFVLIEGTATVEAAGNRLRELGAGSFVGLVGQGGRPLRSTQSVPSAFKRISMTLASERQAQTSGPSSRESLSWSRKRRS